MSGQGERGSRLGMGRQDKGNGKGSSRQGLVMLMAGKGKEGKGWRGETF